jgi:hypothetical protein
VFLCQSPSGLFLILNNLRASYPKITTSITISCDDNSASIGIGLCGNKPEPIYPKGGVVMTALSGFSGYMERYHRIIIAALFGVIVLFLFACTFHDVLPICHYLFGCDHLMH